MGGRAVNVRRSQQQADSDNLKEKGKMEIRADENKRRFGVEHPRELVTIWEHSVARKSSTPTKSPRRLCRSREIPVVIVSISLELFIL